MLHTVTLRTVALATCGWLLAADAAALTVGSARGAVLLGRPLDLSVPVTLDAPGEEPCASADVFHGDEKVRRAPTLRWTAGSGRQGVLRLLSPTPVDEPMVTVELRVGCAQPVSRRFVLLSEVPSPAEAAAPARGAPLVGQAPAAATTPRAAPQDSAGGALGPSAAAAPAAGASTSPRRQRVTPGEAASAALAAERALAAARPSGAAATPPGPRVPRPERAAPQARLKLEPLPLGPVGDPVLRLSSELRSELAVDPQRRAAAAALWLALQKTPDEAMQDALRLQAAEGELKSLRDVTQQNTAAVAQMRAQVEKARGERGTATLLVVLLSLALLALLAWLAWRGWAAMRMNRVGRWFEQHGDSTLSPLSVTRVEPAPAPAAARKLSRAVPEVRETGGAAGFRAGLAASAAARAAEFATAAPVQPARAAAPEEFQVSRGGSMRMVGVEELIDVHDKADFFLSIGEYDQAIAVLQSHISDQVETSALVWMDLLELYHSLGKQVEYERLRTEFRQRFTAQVPDFEHFDQPGASLENYSRALGRIVALWPSPRVLDVIEESIFRQPGLPGAEPFSLEAYRELVLLYHVARDLVEASQAEAAHGQSFRDTSLQPLNLVEQPDIPLGEPDLVLIPPASPRIGVDIDVGEAPGLDFDLDLPGAGGKRH